MSKFKSDLEQEAILCEYLDKVYGDLGFHYTRKTDKESQYKGIDVVLNYKGKPYNIDEKAQLHYLNRNLPTFTFELSYLKNGARREGWLFDKNKLTDYYFLVTNIQLHSTKRLKVPSDIKGVMITSVYRKQLIDLLNTKGLGSEKLRQYELTIRKEIKHKTVITELEAKKEGCLFLSTHLEEQPFNVQLRLQFLLDEGVAKRVW